MLQFVLPVAVAAATVSVYDQSRLSIAKETSGYETTS